ncbi:hypothetical protein COV88_00915 [Candidatus Saccharibacteria bacterium CG11_big_fil_rev_8_21_14_0_20_41_19]|nr:hypothetical protein [Candidatus Saccharibacteria bacterium]OIP86221.1 MAG: hypothetical protein AUK57_00390 [Candidatus Saccharibacteria bacterium CG2_30_41_52]PIQ71033.1 MAG: hypothetical protein COV88_00915 [Candidatus Saccharibacteria bacterium CG11_big_fil_rev_8_21_14_0_20_41_19]PIZ59432.1 MAG: hypothetical protein COY18_03535 [Candidatus Saccharibacteria bacterium CG_4_10_14_0_2_um_filter_41_11]PJC29385.1 MAG: hypothetical protein CO052_03640 [Candidatus Saccharibacteria bacterium CG_4
MKNQLSKKLILKRRALGDKIRRAKRKILVCRLRGAMYMLCLVAKNETKSTKVAMKKSLLNRFDSIREEGCGYKKSFYLTVKWTAEDNGIYDEDLVRTLVNCALALR